MKKPEKNRRSFFRIDASVPMAHRAVAPEERPSLCAAVLTPQEAGALQGLSVTRVDLSGAGIAFMSPERYAPGDIVELTLLLRVRNGALIAYGEVVRAERVRRLFRIALKFVGMDERVRSIITNFVLQRERELVEEKRIGWL